jgi:hypothetical protein
LDEKTAGLLPTEVSQEQSVETRDGSEPKVLTEILAKAGSAPIGGVVATDDDVRTDARNMSLLADTESQVTRLLDLVTQKGVPHAVAVARKMKNYYLLDRMHDELVDTFYQRLIEKGVIEK